MKFIYTNTIDQYTNYLKLEKLKLKIIKKNISNNFFNNF